MSEPKTRPTGHDVDAFLDAIADPARRDDCRALVDLHRQITSEEPVLWGSIVGFGTYHYHYASGREGDWPVAGFASRKRDLTVYVMAGLDRYPAQLAKLGPHKTGVSCLYVKRLADLDRTVLEEILRDSVDFMRQHYPAGGNT